MRKAIGWLGAAAWSAMAAAQQAPAPVTAPPAPPVTEQSPRAAADPAAAPASTAPVGAAQAATPVPPANPAATSQATVRAASGEDDEIGDEVVVRGTRSQPGAVIGDIPPEQQLGPADIRSYGVSSVSDLLDELAPQTRSDRGSGGRPVVLLNGRRISGFQEVRDLPTEAIARVDILPEEVALKYGYTADQRVVNIVLRRRFRAATVELAGSVPTEGGNSTKNPTLDLLNIRGQGRFNVHLNYNAQSALTEAERGIIAQPSNFAIGGNVVAANGGVLDPQLGAATVAGVPAAAANGPVPLSAFAAGTANTTDPGRYRTLLPSTRAFTGNLVYATTIFGNVGATLNGEIETSDSVGLLGLPTVQFALPAGNPYSPFANPVLVDRSLPAIGPLAQRISSVTGHLGTTLNGTISAGWRWSMTGTYDRAVSDTFTNQGFDATGFQARLNAADPGANPFGPLGPAYLALLNDSTAHSVSSSGAVDALVNGSLFRLPAGEISTAIHVGGTTSSFTSRSYRAGLVTAGDVSRNIVNGQINVDVPIASRGKDVLAWLGNLSVNGNLAVNHLSDFGTLTTRGFGVNWSPITPVRLLASITNQGDAPTAAQLGNPIVTTPNQRVFDYVTGTTATVTTVSGGNPALARDSRHTAKVEFNLKPWSAKDVTVVANYITTHTDDAIASFPALTAAIQTAFPDRFTRVGGTLTRIDTRPINFARTERSELRYGINLSFPLKSKLQKQIEAFRAGTGPNPFAGLRPPGFVQRDRARQQAEQGGQQGTANAFPPPPPEGAPPPPPGGDGPPPPGGGGPGGGGPGGGGPGGGGRGFGGRPGGFGGRGQAGGRLQFALYHTWHFTNRVLIRDGGPALDLLNGDAIGGSGGQPRHELEGQAGYSNNGLGARLSVDYQSGTTVTGGTAGAPTTLDFGSLATADLRLFADFSGRLDLIRKHPWLRGTRVTLAFVNLFDTRQQVRDATGATPVSLQAAYLNPLGRSVRLSVRKLFF